MNINKQLAKRLTPEQLSILIDFVKNKKEVPIRIVYTQGYWDKIAKDNKYELANRELNALKKSISEVAKKLNGKKINIIHLGVGNGVECQILIDAVGAKNISIYSIVDVNPKMLDFSFNKIKEKYPAVRIRKFNQDIETYGIDDICLENKKDGSEINLIVLIANGVLFSNTDLVKEIYKNMGKNDYFLLSLELYSRGKDEEIINPYLIPSVLELLSNGLRILGYAPKYSDFSGEIDKKENLLKIYFKSPEEDKLLVLRSYKPDISKLNSRMSSLGFEIVFAEEHKDIHTCVALFKKKLT